MVQKFFSEDYIFLLLLEIFSVKLFYNVSYYKENTFLTKNFSLPYFIHSIHIKTSFGEIRYSRKEYNGCMIYLYSYSK